MSSAIHRYLIATASYGLIRSPYYISQRRDKDKLLLLGDKVKNVFASAALAPLLWIPYVVDDLNEIDAAYNGHNGQAYSPLPFSFALANDRHKQRQHDPSQASKSIGSTN
jgi:hypothetical protein